MDLAACRTPHDASKRIRVEKMGLVETAEVRLDLTTSLEGCHREGKKVSPYPVPRCCCRFWIPIFDFHFHLAATAPRGAPVPPDRPGSSSANRGQKETECLGIIRKHGAHQGDDEDREEEDKKARDDIELPCIEERRPSHAC